MYPAYKAHAPHCTVICNPSGCNIFFHIISKTARISKKKFIENKMCVLIFSTSLTETFIIIRKTERDLIINLHTSSCQVPVILFFIFEFPCIISLYYIRNQLDATLTVLFISNCKNTLHVPDVHRVHHQEYINCISSHYYFVDNRPWTSLLAIYHPDPWHTPVAATAVYVLLMIYAVNVRNI
jgi:hypothetical protein